ncbi:PfkB family carbohydrate kinase [Nocardioides sp. AN3]
MSVVVVGGANIDLKARSRAPVVPGTSNPGRATLSPGGVGRNIADNLARLGTATTLVTAVGADLLGDDLLGSTATAGVDISCVRRTQLPTGTYTAVLDEGGELVVAVADMAAVESLSPGDVDAVADRIAEAELLILDGNLMPATLSAGVDIADRAGVRVVVDPVSVPKAQRLADAVRRPLFLLTPNADELRALTGLADDTAAIAELRRRGAQLVWLRRGPAGSVLSTPDGPVVLASTADEVVDVTGAGDAMLAAFCHFLLAGAAPAEAARLGHSAAALTVASASTVRPDLTETLVRSRA